MPTTEPGPVTICHRSAGSPASAIRARVHSRVSAVCESALDTTALPHEECGQYVADTEVQGVVPGRDDADNSLRHPHLLDPRRAGDHPAYAAGRQVVPGAPRVVPGDRRDLGHLHPRVVARLARLPLDQVERLVLPLQQQVVEGEYEVGAALVRCPRPCRLGGAGARHRLRHFLRGAGGNGRDRREVERRPCGQRFGGLGLVAFRVAAHPAAPSRDRLVRHPRGAGLVRAHAGSSLVRDRCSGSHRSLRCPVGTLADSLVDDCAPRYVNQKSHPGTRFEAWRRTPTPRTSGLVEPPGQPGKRVSQ